MSSSAWSLWVTVLRNMGWSFLMLMPGLAALSLLPLAVGEMHGHWHNWGGAPWLRAISWLAMAQFGWSLVWPFGEAKLVIASAGFTMAYGRLNDTFGGEREDRGFEAREWTSFWQGHIASVTALWLALTVLVVVGPALLYATTHFWSATTGNGERPLLHALESLLSLAAAAVAGRVLGSSANEAEATPTRRRINPRLVGTAESMLLLVIAVSWCAEEVQRLVVHHPVYPDLVGKALGERWVTLFETRISWVRNIKAGVVWDVCISLLCISWLAGQALNINRIYLQSVYRNRLTQAFLGAARAWIGPRDNGPEQNGANAAVIEPRQADPLTGFDPADNMSMSDLVCVQPLLLCNLTLHMREAKDTVGCMRTVHPFTVTPTAAGSAALGEVGSNGESCGAYRPVDAYTGPGGVSVAGAMSVAGAAANPNFGSQSSAAVRMLLILMNVRLGVWWGNPAHRSNWRSTNPCNAALALLQEAVVLPGPTHAAVHLADGGHFENLGLYEMVRRRCSLLLVSDASADPSGSCDSLALSVRMCETDFGVRVRLTQVFAASALPVTADVASVGERAAPTAEPGSVDLSLLRIAAGGVIIGEVIYPPKVLPSGQILPASVAKLLYCKPRVTGEEPLVVQNYHRKSALFPHESTADQWFSEAQFEAYYQLGQHVGRQVAQALVAHHAEFAPLTSQQLAQNA
ncbi:MAG: hypothetical protein EXR77_03670 [Myxococcales bacterium]|nr:hypothetical protein [Myxococcales bacterium]